MVKGLTVFRDFFSDYTDQFVLIGGTACDLLMDDAGLGFRATKDLDVVLCIEALTSGFVQKLWKFVERGVYQRKEKASGEKCCYRFSKPVDSGFPFMIELFSRVPDILDDREIAGITPMAIGDSIVSLSAILLDEPYYRLILSNRLALSGVNVVSPACLIVLKAKAWMDLRRKKSDGAGVSDSNIKKHRNDVFRLSQLVGKVERLVLPLEIQRDVLLFLEMIAEDDIDIKQFGMPHSSKEEIIDLLRIVFGV